MNKLLYLLLLLFCLQSTVKAQAASPSGVFPVISEIAFYHEMKDSLPVYLSRVLSGAYQSSDVIHLVRLYNTVHFYENSIGTTKTLGYKDSIVSSYWKGSIGKLASEYPKSRVIRSNYALIVDSVTNLPVFNLYLIELDIVKQAKIKVTDRCLDIFDWPVLLYNMSQEEYDEIRNKLYNQRFFWGDENAYFLPLEEWVEFVSDQEMRGIIKEYEPRFLKRLKDSGWLEQEPIEFD